MCAPVHSCALIAYTQLATRANLQNYRTMGTLVGSQRAFSALSAVLCHNHWQLNQLLVVNSILAPQLRPSRLPYTSTCWRQTGVIAYPYAKKASWFNIVSSTVHLRRMTFAEYVYLCACISCTLTMTNCELAAIYCVCCVSVFAQLMPQHCCLVCWFVGVCDAKANCNVMICKTLRPYQA